MKTGETLTFDKIVFATPPDQIPSLLADPTDEEKNALPLGTRIILAPRSIQIPDFTVHTVSILTLSLMSSKKTLVRKGDITLT